MRSNFHCELINGPFGDPGLLVDFKFERRALMFDIGDLGALPTRKLLRVSDVFVTHAHMDHFAGFDRYLRVALGRDTGVRLFGPPQFIDRVAHKLAAYTWNLLDAGGTDFVVTVTEVDADWKTRTARFRSRTRFAREDLPGGDAPVGRLVAERSFSVDATFLDHRIPVLGFALTEAMHINVLKNRLIERGLPTGPWLTKLKALVRDGAADDTPVEVRWRDRGGSRVRTFPLGELKDSVLEFVPGEKIGYVTDVAYQPDNVARIEALVRGADRFYIECVFLDADRDHAERKAHLTARQAGTIARSVGARIAVPFHFSPRYLEQEREIREEFETARRCASGSTGAVQ
jgi:ribonuclease Z